MEKNKGLQIVKDTLKEAKTYQHAAGVLQYDQETICPPAAMEEQGEIVGLMYNKAYALTRSPEFMEAVKSLYEEHLEELDPYDAANISYFYRDFKKNEAITPELQLEFSRITNKGFVAWLNGKKKADYKEFLPALKEITEMEKKKVELSPVKFEAPYDFVLDTYEEGVTSADLDLFFGKFKERMIPLLKEIQASKKNIRTDFLSRQVPREGQIRLAEKLMDIIGMDPDRRALTESEHPFTDGYSYNDVRITTHYYDDAFTSSMYSVIHEGGHALFEQWQPKENFDHYLNHKTMGQHESVSRFYENRIGRSRGFLHLIYPTLCEVFPEAMRDVSEKELYEALNVVTPSLIRTESDEFTYTFHIIIRYEIERDIMEGKIDLAHLDQIWSDKYAEYLGVRPENDREGLLQDMHWSEGYGYFPAYALGNMYNSMYFNAMNQEFDVDDMVSQGKLDVVLDWMKEHVFKKADQLDPKPWIKDITGRDLTVDDFLDYLEEKYRGIYQI